MKVELIKAKYYNPLVKVREHHYRCNPKFGCTCMERRYRNDYNFKLETKTFEALKTNSKKYSLLCKVDNEFYYCYNLNEMLDVDFVPINIRFENDYFLWEVDGVNGQYKSVNFFKTKTI